MEVNSGDRFFLYTDVLVEPENALGESFGERQLERALRSNSTLPSAELAQQLLSALQVWQARLNSQQDDITLVVVDVL